ncbi:MAG: outer membrane beta-barrel protein [Ignavibacterium sp.]|nr:MAG: outer membrane beta-barrel protein [Ignavibacterium sp.]
MQKIFLVLLSLTFILCFNANVHAQLVKVGAGGGYSNITGPDFYTNSIANDGLGFSSGYNLGIIAKIGLPLVPLTPRGIFLYNNFSNEEGGVEYSQAISSLGLGVQYGFIPVPAGFDPYLFLDLMYNNFGDIDGLSNGGGFSRFGLQFGVGTEVSIIPVVNLDVFAGYNWYNLTGKEDGEDTVTTFVIDVFVMFNFL